MDTGFRQGEYKITKIHHIIKALSQQRVDI